jgi:hypothetical protein
VLEIFIYLATAIRRFGPKNAIFAVTAPSHVEIGDAEGVCLDEVTARLDEVAH